MIKIATALALLCAVAAPAIAGPCVALDYQEMKDMSADELLNEACNARLALGRSLDETITNLGARDGAPTFPNAQESFDQCAGQITRIDRVLASKGLTKEAVIEACQKKKTSKSAAR